MGVCGSKEASQELPATKRQTPNQRNGAVHNTSLERTGGRAPNSGIDPEGKKLGGSGEKKLSPREAAALAAEQRQKKVEEEALHGGALSRKLQAEKKKSANNYLRQQAEQANRERHTETFVYD